METHVFLFTDIEGSARLWSEHPADMGAALARHDQLLGEAISGAGGSVFKHTGEGVCAVFPSVSEAVRAAAAAQRALAGADWGALGAVRARMAVHAGEAEPRGGDWFGPALNRAARLMGIGHGGQVLLSAAAHALAADGLGAELGAVDLGSHRLRDLAGSEHAWQLVGHGLERSFPPLRSFDGYRGRLPAHLTSFIGRQEELSMIGDEVLAARLVTLVGPGGVGKSRLAARAGAAVIDKFSDGAWMFEFAPVSTLDGLVAAMMATLGLSGAPGVPLRDVLVEALRPWRALLIFDNCEHLLDATAELVPDLLAAGPGLVVLATSREPLRVPGERIVTVGPFTSEAEAVQLFVDRAGAANRALVSNVADRDTVARICSQLDGMPLAIELAAGRTIVMTPIEIEHRLDQRFRLLAARGRDGDDRHGSLQRVVDWSFDLLDAEHQLFFARLAVFAGDFDADAAHRVCWPDDEFVALDMLEDLVAKSLLTATRRGARTAYRMLETMRQYGFGQLQPEEVDSLRDRHAEFFAELAEMSWDGVRSRQNQVWLEVVDDALDNLRAAYHHSLARGDTDRVLRIAAGLFMYNHSRRLPEVFAWLDEAFLLPGWGDHRLARHARLHWAFGQTLAGQLEKSEEEARAVLDAGTGDPDPLEPLALIVLSAALGNQGHVAESKRLSTFALDRAAKLGPAFDYDRAEALWNLCCVAVFSGSPDVLRSQECLELAKQIGNARAMAGGLLHQGFSEPDPERAMELLAEARELTARTRDWFRHGWTIWLGAVRSPLNPVHALQSIPALVDLARSAGLRLLVAFTMRSYLEAFAAVARYDVVAVLDSASLPVSVRPDAAKAAIAEARRVLGEERYDNLRAEGKRLSPAELDDFLISAVADLQ